MSYPYLLPTDRDWELQGATVTEPNDQEVAELYDEKAQQEIAICQRIYRGLATKEDAQYVLWALGHGTDLKVFSS